MRRWVLVTVIPFNVAAFTALAFSPSWPTFAGAGASSLLFIPVMHYFKAGRTWSWRRGLSSR